MKMRRQLFSWQFVVLCSLGLVAMALLIGCGGDSSAPPKEEPTPVTNPTLIPLLSDAQRTATYVGSAKCGQCHGARNGGRGIHADWSETEHAKKGVECEKCHGPGSAHVAGGGDKAKILTYPNIVSPIVCAQCHNSHVSKELDQHDAWIVSSHREVVEDVVNGNPREPCYRCHESWYKHLVVDEGVALSGDDLAVWANLEKAAIEAGDPQEMVSSANCIVCHDPHAKTGNIVDEEGKDLQVRRKPFVAGGDPEVNKIKTAPGGAADPVAYTSFNHACAQCHNGRGTDPTDEGLKRTTSRPSMHDSNQYNMLIGQGGSEADGPAPIRRETAHAGTEKQCITCHMKSGEGQHTFVVKLDACAPCHTSADAAARRQATQDEITQKIWALRQRLETWGNTQDVGIPKGPTAWEYSALGGTATTSDDQKKIPIEIKRARHNYYFIIRDASYGVHNAAYARYLIQMANLQLDRLGVAQVSAAASQSRSWSAIRDLLRKSGSSAEARGFPE